KACAKRISAVTEAIAGPRNVGAYAPFVRRMLLGDGACDDASKSGASGPNDATPAVLAADEFKQVLQLASNNNMACLDTVTTVTTTTSRSTTATGDDDADGDSGSHPDVDTAGGAVTLADQRYAIAALAHLLCTIKDVETHHHKCTTDAGKSPSSPGLRKAENLAALAATPFIRVTNAVGQLGAHRRQRNEQPAATTDENQAIAIKKIVDDAFSKFFWFVLHQSDDDDIQGAAKSGDGANAQHGDDDGQIMMNALVREVK
ncbi:MAG: hypothetical protein Q8M03_05355, partial [Legionella sp.]|nr:hypothetical protein [Legionella sp.]